MTSYRIAEAADLLGVSDDTIRRWVDAGRIEASTENGRAVIDGIVLATLASELADAPNPDRTKAVSARNRMLGIVTKTTLDTVMAQVEMVCGPYRIVSLMSAEAAIELGLEPGVSAVASIKSTNVVVERP
ncbi:putative molybdenum-pterin binding domain protein [Nocardioidaceae bacterium Broad-1]|nr:putative molybdenum-pterin binding domain protein [Nocardioidaceae bacterium Broad-1]